MIKKLTDHFRPPKTKVCNACKKEKPLKQFYLNPDNKDGRTNKCIACLLEVEDKKTGKKAEYAKQFFTHDKYYL